MSAAPVVLHESVEDPQAELWFAEPPGFVSLPLDALLAEPGSSAAEALRVASAPLLDAAPGELARQRVVAQLAQGQQMLSALCRFGTVYCAIGLHRDDVDSSGAVTPLLSLLTITWHDTNVAPRTVTAARAVTSVSGHTNVARVDLPCGPGVLSETTSPPPPTPVPGLPPLPLLQVHAHLPHPDCKRMAVLALSTVAVARRGEYRGILRQVVETVRFEDPMGRRA
ncbi:hypothetical protein [Streptomyces parvulus]|uniref:hypothetical protein n=1 Tax=Streptomyces parvulus TaxID=146923 RepID=UPI00368A9C95